MIGTFLVLFGASVLLSLAFIVAIWPDRRRDSVMFWFLVALAGVAVPVDSILFIAVAGTKVSPWWLASALALQDGVFTWRLALALRSRVRERMANR